MPVRAGFTLIEMVVSLCIVSIIFLAMGSVMILATKAIPRTDSVPTLAMDGAGVIESITSDLETALTITTAAPNVIEFTVPDRDGDGNDENIKYEWSTSQGDPLLRQYNGGAIVEVLPSVFECGFYYVANTGNQQTQSSRSDELEMSSYIPAQSRTYTVTGLEAVGQSFMPSNLPPEAETWNVTRVVLMAKPSGSAVGQMAVQLRPRGVGGLPTSTVLEQQILNESSFSNQFAWQSVTFNNVEGLSRTQGLCVVVLQVGSDSPGSLQHDNTGGGMIASVNGGASWSIDNRSSIAHFVYGTYDTPVAVSSGTRLRTVSLVLNTGETDASRTRLCVLTLNRPEMP